MYTYTLLTVHETTSFKLRVHNLFWRVLSDELRSTCYTHDYFTHNRVNGSYVLRCFDRWRCDHSAKLPPNIDTVYIFSDSHERSNAHVYICDYLRRKMRKKVVYVSFAPRHGHSNCDGHFAHGKQKLRNMVTSDGVRTVAQAMQAFASVATTVDFLSYKDILPAMPVNVKLKGINSFFAFVYEVDGSDVKLYDYHLNFAAAPQRVHKLNPNYIAAVDAYLKEEHDKETMDLIEKLFEEEYEEEERWEELLNEH